MTMVTVSGYKTPFARYLFEHDISLRAAEPMFGSNRTTLGRIAQGVHLARGKTRERIAQALLGELTIDDLRAIAAAHDTAETSGGDA